MIDDDTYMKSGRQRLDFFIGVIGEYLGKIYLETKHRPVYIVEKFVNTEDDSDILTDDEF